MIPIIPIVKIQPQPCTLFCLAVNAPIVRIIPANNTHIPKSNTSVKVPSNSLNNSKKPSKMDKIPSASTQPEIFCDFLSEKVRDCVENTRNQ